MYDGLQVYTVGHLLPKDAPSGESWYDKISEFTDFANPLQILSQQDGFSDPPPSSQPSQKLTVRRSTYVPGWSVPPRVLLVDDDAVSRQLSSKFLQVFGCTIDVAVDGVTAVNKMNLEKYDLVLMVRTEFLMDAIY